ncbi:MAG TPA: copper chaperone PCu(A)C [Mycobacteriales bacterium]|jgi:copper(I)-binding protein|nr:copper chaperone PCu(A)C [Mycobacteriales bacterium]
MIPRRTLGATVIAVLPLVAACGAGRNTATDKERQTPYVAHASVGALLVTAVSLVPSQAGSTGSTPAASSPTPSAGNSSGSTVADGFLVVSIVNRGSSPDQLTGVQVQGASVTPTDVSQQALTLPPKRAVTFGDPDSGSGGNALQVSNLSQPLTIGTSVPVTFQFRNAGSVTLNVLVRDNYGTTATSTPLPLTGSYPAATETPEGLPTGG